MVHPLYVTLIVIVCICVIFKCADVIDFLENILCFLFNGAIFVYAPSKKLWLTQRLDQELISLTLKRRRRRNTVELKWKPFAELIYVLLQQ